jgi:hypothetical protein
MALVFGYSVSGETRRNDMFKYEWAISWWKSRSRSRLELETDRNDERWRPKQQVAQKNICERVRSVNREARSMKHAAQSFSQSTDGYASV